MDEISRVLVIDDVQFTQMVLIRYLEEIGISDVQTAFSGEEGLEKLNKAYFDKCPFDLVLLDWCMPGISGLGLLKSLRADGRFDKTKILMVTADNEAESVLAASEAGADGFITKPFNASIIRMHIAKVFQGQLKAA